MRNVRKKRNYVRSIAVLLMFLLGLMNFVSPALAGTRMLTPVWTLNADDVVAGDTYELRLAINGAQMSPTQDVWNSLNFKITYDPMIWDIVDGLNGVLPTNVPPSTKKMTTPAPNGNGLSQVDVLAFDGLTEIPLINGQTILTLFIRAKTKSTETASLVKGFTVLKSPPDALDRAGNRYTWSEVSWAKQALAPTSIPTLKPTLTPQPFVPPVVAPPPYVPPVVTPSPTAEPTPTGSPTPMPTEEPTIVTPLPTVEPTVTGSPTPEPTIVPINSPVVSTSPTPITTNMVAPLRTPSVVVREVGNKQLVIDVNPTDGEPIRLVGSVLYQSLKNSSSDKDLQIHVKTNAKHVDIELPVEQINSLTTISKRDVVVDSNFADLYVPVSLLQKSNEPVRVKIVYVENPSESLLQTMTNKSKGELLSKPVEFNMSIAIPKNTWVSRLITTNLTAIDQDQMTGVVYLPNANTVIPVPTRWVKRADGTYQAEIRCDGKGIYSLIRTKKAIRDLADAKLSNRSALKWLVGHQIMSVSSKGEIYPARHVTRAEALHAIIRAFGVVPETYTGKLKDVRATSSFAKDWQAASSLHWIDSETVIFKPDKPVSLQQIREWLLKAVRMASANPELNPTISSPNGSSKTVSRQSMAKMLQEAVDQIGFNTK